jgi:hypothetical protein
LSPKTQNKHHITGKKKQMKQDQKQRKVQADRLLKQLPMSDRKRQQQIRQQIMRDLQFSAV